MKRVSLLIQILFCRIKNRLFIFASQRTEVFFSVLLIVIASISAAVFLPSLLEYEVEINISLFPSVSYIFITASIFPFLIWFLKKNESDNNTSYSIIDYIYKEYLKYLKSISFYIIPAVLSFLFLYIVLSIYNNIMIMYSVIFWQIVSLLLFLISYMIVIFINKFVVKMNLVSNSFTLFKTLFILFFLLLITLPIHKFIGIHWLRMTVPPSLIYVFYIAVVIIYIYTMSMRIYYGAVVQGNEKSRCKNYNVYFFLLIFDLRKNIIFFIMTMMFLIVLSYITKQFYVMVELFQVIAIIGNIGFVFNKVMKTAKPLFMLRASNFKFSIWLLHCYFITSIFFMIIFCFVISILGNSGFIAIIENSSFFIFCFVLYFSIYISIIISYLFGEYLGAITQSISSGIILIISYKVIPEIITRVSMIEIPLLKIIVFIFFIFVLFVIKWVTVKDYKINEIS
ncbi:hypothetical protein [Bacillus halotolerans]|uniref:hypothetical protein n=2 Tax=Bacillus TaxID=1386 RepID=UPI002DBBE70F|nr:hypothetical protein [Bacillus halotolerans]MEC0253304.1 hypothetical protein [Bacillus halotolerans]MEC0359940.1 hypothetical protein [Bacillus halotolerans]